MANNRLYLRHKPTGKEILLCKYYPDDRGWYIFHDEEKLNEWFNQFADHTMWGDTRFEVYPEINETWFELLRFRIKLRWRKLKRKWRLA